MRCVYRYQGVDAGGTIVGTIESDGLDEAWYEVNRRMGIEPQSLRLSVLGTLQHWIGFGGIPMPELARLYQVMADRRHAGLSLSVGLREAMDYSPSGSVVTLLALLRQALLGGHSLADAMALAGFPALDTSAIRAVRQSGSEVGVLRGLAEQAGRVHQLRRRVTSVAAYPVLVAMLAWILAWAITLFIAPRLSHFLGATALPGGMLPGWVETYYSIAQQASGHPIAFTAIWIVGPIAMALLSGRSLARQVRNLPGPARIRRLLDQVAVWSAFARLHEAGVRPAEIFEELAAASSVANHKRQLTAVASSLRAGSLSLARAVRTARFPARVAAELSAGESSLNYGAAVLRLVGYLRDEIDRECTRLERLSSLLAYALVGAIVVLLASVAVLPQLSAAFARL